MSNRPPTVQTFTEDKQFDGDSNWLAFKSQLLLAAGAAGVTGYLDGSIPQPLSTGLTATFLSGVSTQWNDPNPLYLKWQLRNRHTAALIVQNICNPIGCGVDKSDSAEDIWTALIAGYNTSTEVGKITAENNLRAERFRDGDDFVTFLKTMCQLRMEANHAGAGIVDKDFCIITPLIVQRNDLNV